MKQLLTVLFTAPTAIGATNLQEHNVLYAQNEAQENEHNENINYLGDVINYGEDKDLEGNIIDNGSFNSSIELNTLDLNKIGIKSAYSFDLRDLSYNGADYKIETTGVDINDTNTDMILKREFVDIKVDRIHYQEWQTFKFTPVGFEERMWIYSSGYTEDQAFEKIKDKTLFEYVASGRNGEESIIDVTLEEWGDFSNMITSDEEVMTKVCWNCDRWFEHTLNYSNDMSFSDNTLKDSFHRHNVHHEDQYKFVKMDKAWNDSSNTFEEQTPNFMPEQPDDIDPPPAPPTPTPPPAPDDTRIEPSFEVYQSFQSTGHGGWPLSDKWTYSKLGIKAQGFDVDNVTYSNKYAEIIPMAEFNTIPVYMRNHEKQVTENEVNEWELNVTYQKDDLVLYNNKLYVSLWTDISSSRPDASLQWKEIEHPTIMEFDNEQFYQNQDVVYINDEYYYANGNQSPGDFNPNNWIAINWNH